METKLFRCKICGKILSGEDARREHCKIHHPAVPFKKLDIFFKIDFSEQPRLGSFREIMTPQRRISSLLPEQKENSQHTAVRGIQGYNSSQIPEKIRIALSSGMNLFITGKAGTGKTTILKEVVKELTTQGKCVAVLAPTGVAAKNAGGVTIHSFLKLSLSPYLPNVKIKDLYNLSAENITAIRHLHTIIIDEVSMVRCDLLDMVDDVLKHYRNSTSIFGGVRIIAFGDLYQLMPVVTSKDWPLLKEWYRSPYFFSSKVYEAHPFRMITLTKVYRQTDSDFLDLLNEVRNGVISDRNLTKLKHLYQDCSRTEPKKDVIRLTTHNRLADSYNNNIFDNLQGYESEYDAIITGYVHFLEYPTANCLRLKEGARVMFIRNDTSKKQLYVNGTLGTVVRCGSESVTVKLDNSGRIIQVTKQVWYYDEYFYNRSTKTLEIRHRGTFTQIPLKLAWAITIHKSQGLTFDKVIIDAGKAFAYGQVYVALSRCRHFNGITLATPISAEIIKTDPIVKHFMNPKKDNEDMPAFKLKKISDKRPKKPENIHGLALLKWLAENDYTIDEMSIETGYNNISLVYHDLCKLISKGKLGLACRLSIAKIKDMTRAWEMLGLHADVRDIKPLCKTDVNYGEILMVRSYLEYISGK